ncbi:MAG: hypothetical protein FJW39_08515 [Acidobacteria bacterium]|nr:hypothetical protein [Acidobacteriota bacterium]
MTKQHKARILTGILMAAALGAVLLRNTRVTDTVASAIQPRPDPTPQDTIYSMFDAARDGNVGDYLRHYTGQMETSLKQTVSEQGESRFAGYLKQTNAPVKGIAIMEPQVLTDREVKLRVEYVYQDRNEVQMFYLEKQGKDWRIARLETAERIKTLVPYGTPVR